MLCNEILTTESIKNEMIIQCAIQLPNIEFEKLRTIYTPYLKGSYIFVHNENNKMFAYDVFKKKWIEYSPPISYMHR
jgi:hypothetical protein